MLNFLGLKSSKKTEFTLYLTLCSENGLKDEFTLCLLYAFFYSEKWSNKTLWFTLRFTLCSENCIEMILCVNGL